MTTDLSVLFQQALPPIEARHTYAGLKPSEWIMIAAILIGPILAVVTQFIWQKTRQKHDQKLWVFGTLMINRHAPLTPDFVKAANYIDVVFYKNQKVRARWKTVLDHLSSDAYKPANFTIAAFEKFRDLLAELLADMAKDLRYHYDYTHIKESAWNPTQHGQEFEDKIKLTKGLLGLTDGTGVLNVAVMPHPSSAQQAVPAQATAQPPAPTSVPQPKTQPTPPQPAPIKKP